MDKSAYDKTTFIDQKTGFRVGSIEFALPSLKEGMSINLADGLRLVVISWEYVFEEGPLHGLIVSVKVQS
jgi:hypothetical protein